MPTGPVTTFLDFVVHVPVSCVSTWAVTKGVNAALKASRDLIDTIIEVMRVELRESRYRSSRIQERILTTLRGVTSR